MGGVGEQINRMPVEQLLFLPKGNQISITDLLTKINTYLLNPTELGHHGCASCKEGWSKVVEMDKSEGQEQSQTEFQIYKNQMLS